MADEQIARRADGEALLHERLVAAFGAATVAASDVRIEQRDDGATVAHIGGVRLGLGHDGLLFCAAVHAGVEHLAVVESDGRLRWVARVPLASPAMN